jgi:hypothetical protein
VEKSNLLDIAKKATTAYLDFVDAVGSEQAHEKLLDLNTAMCNLTNEVQSAETSYQQIQTFMQQLKQPMGSKPQTADTGSTPTPDQMFTDLSSLMKLMSRMSEMIPNKQQEQASVAPPTTRKRR